MVVPVPSAVDRAGNQDAAGPTTSAYRGTPRIYERAALMAYMSELVRMPSA